MGSDYGMAHSVGVYSWVVSRGPPHPGDDDLLNILYIDAVMIAVGLAEFIGITKN